MTRDRWMTFLRLTALALTAIILVPSGAHLFELAGKIGLPRDAYFTVQSIYAGWAWFVIPILAAILANVALFLTERRGDPTAARAALLSAVLIIVSPRRFLHLGLPRQPGDRELDGSAGQLANPPPEVGNRPCCQRLHRLRCTPRDRSRDHRLC
jgi:hypothetical protein